MAPTYWLYRQFGNPRAIPPNIPGAEYLAYASKNQFLALGKHDNEFLARNAKNEWLAKEDP